MNRQNEVGFIKFCEIILRYSVLWIGAFQFESSCLLDCVDSPKL